MKKLSLIRNLYLLSIASLTAVFTIGMVSVQTARSDTAAANSGIPATASVTRTSDIVVKIVSIPQTAKACQTFKATVSATNLGPDPVPRLGLGAWLPDQLELVSQDKDPGPLRVGQTVIFSVRIKVVAFVPGESREAWVGISMLPYISQYTESDPNAIDPNQEDNSIFSPLRLIGKHVMTCP